MSASGIDLTWLDNSATETGFRIERCAGAGCAAYAEIATVGAGVQAYGSTGLSASTSYSYRVRAWNAGGHSSYSNSASATTPPLVVLPAAPSNLTAVAASGSQINLAWTDNSSTETGFRIERCTGGGCSTFAVVATVGAGVQAYANTGLSAGTSYSYRVHAFDAVGNSPYSNTASASTPAAPIVEQTVLASADNLVLSNSADATVANRVYASSELGAGYSYFYFFNSITGTFQLGSVLGAATLLRFNVQTAIAGRTILEARLILWPHSLPADYRHQFRLAAVQSTWSASTVTWNTFLTMTHYPTGAVNFTPASSSAVAQEFDVTTIVQNWANGTFQNNGFQLWDPTPSLPGAESYQMIAYQSLNVYTALSRRPQLFIRYQ